MKKFTSLITAGFLASLSLIPAQASALSTTTTMRTTTIPNSSTTTTIDNAGTIIEDGDILANFSCDETYSIAIGEELDLDKIMISLSAWGTNADGYIYNVYAGTLNYSFSIGSRKHAHCYVYNTSSVDTSKAGTYYIHVCPIANVKEPFVIENSMSTVLPNGTYDMKVQGGVDFYIPINVFDPESTTEITSSENTTQTTIYTHTTPVYTTTNTYLTTGITEITEPSLIGDANCDGKVNIADSTMIVQYISNPDKYKLSKQGMLNADVDGLAGISGTDASVIQQLETGLISSLPITVE